MSVWAKAEEALENLATHRANTLTLEAFLEELKSSPNRPVEFNGRMTIMAEGEMSKNSVIVMYSGPMQVVKQGRHWISNFSDKPFVRYGVSSSDQPLPFCCNFCVEGYGGDLIYQEEVEDRQGNRKGPALVGKLNDRGYGSDARVVFFAD